jgi:hypothetical protein
MEQPISTPRYDDAKMKLPGDRSPKRGSDTMVKQTHFGLIIGLLFIVLILVLGGLMLWQQVLVSPPAVTVVDTTRPGPEVNGEPESVTAVAEIEASSALSTSNELDAIAADLGSTNFDTLERELPAIDAEVAALGN